MTGVRQEERNSSAGARPWLRRFVFTTSHRVVGVQYLLLALAAVVLGTLLSLAMRWHIAWSAASLPGWGVVKPEDYLALVTLHGTLMLFFVLTAAPQNGMASLILPAQLGSDHMALPRLNAFSMWIILLGLLVLIATPFVPGGAAISGWTSYPPLSAIGATGPGQQLGMDGWLVSIGLFSIGSLLSAASVIATVIMQRANGMRWMRMPITAWSWFVGACMMVPAFCVLFAASSMLFSDRHFGTSFFLASVEVVNGIVMTRAGGSPLLWQHLFWFFGHPEVYIAILPAMGFATLLLTTFAGAPPSRQSKRDLEAAASQADYGAGYRTMVFATIAIGVLGFMVWGHHMFVSGMNPYASRSFGLTTIAIAIPSSIEVIAWLAWILRGGLRRTTPLLFTLGFVSLFITGGATGPMLAQPILDTYLNNTFFVVAHFHLIMSMAGIFALFAAIYYWFPWLTGRMMSERLGRWHFGLSLAGAYAVFLPMYFAGLAGEPRQYAQLSGTAMFLGALLPMQRFISWAAFVLAAAQLLFLWNLATSLMRGQVAEPNPWNAGTLEWLPASNFSDDGIQLRQPERAF